MSKTAPPTNLEKTRERVAAQVRALRMERRWTQAALAQKLGLSQARLSELERGDGSFTAEQLLEVLRIFNVTLDVFTAPSGIEDELQNTLERLGARHLRTVSSVLPSARVGSVRAAVRETLLSPKDSRLVLALAPVLLTNIESLSLDVLHHDLTAVGFPARVPWLVENVYAALRLYREALNRDARRHRIARAQTVLGDFISRHPAPHSGSERPVDHFDSNLRSERSLAQVLASASEISRRWGVVSELQPEHFFDALRAADVTA